MGEFTLQFDVPAELRSIFEREIGIHIDQMAPLLEWLARHGGRMRLSGNETAHQTPALF